MMPTVISLHNHSKELLDPTNSPEGSEVAPSVSMVIFSELSAVPMEASDSGVSSSDARGSKINISYVSSSLLTHKHTTQNKLNWLLYQQGIMTIIRTFVLMTINIDIEKYLQVFELIHLTGITSQVVSYSFSCYYRSCIFMWSHDLWSSFVTYISVIISLIEMEDLWFGWICFHF